MATNLLEWDGVKSGGLDEVLQEDPGEHRGQAVYETTSPPVSGQGPDGPGDDDADGDDADESGWPPDEPGD